MDGLEEDGIKVRYKNGLKDGRWALLDMGSVITHVFDNEARDFYGLEYLWQEAKPVNWA